MLSPVTAHYKTVTLPPDPAAGDLRSLIEPYRAMIVSQMQLVLDRTERSEHYPWIDTKLDLITGEELPRTDPLLGRDVVCGWVQGRGLESIVKFASWLTPLAGDSEVDPLIERTLRLTADLLARLRSARAQNGGHLHFYMTPSGEAFLINPAMERRCVSLGPSTPHNYSDLFSAKGMYAAANLLGDDNALSEARSFCLSVYGDILGASFRTDQPQPAAGARSWVAGASSHGPHMIALGIAALFAQFEPGPESAELGLRLARHILDAHVNIDGRWPDLAEYDLVEFVDKAGAPYADESGRIISDPGHSLEFVGLLLKFSRSVRSHGGATAAQTEELQRIEQIMPALLARAFGNGFRPEVGGICKTVDLVTRVPVDDTMPWWSLPETIRAGLASWRVAESEESRRACLQIVAHSHNAFVTHYVRPQLHLMAVKVRDARGQVVDQMTSFPDADPGYHTALSLIDALELIPA